MYAAQWLKTRITYQSHGYELHRSMQALLSRGNHNSYRFGVDLQEFGRMHQTMKKNKCGRQRKRARAERNELITHPVDEIKTTNQKKTYLTETGSPYSMSFSAPVF